MEEVFIAAGAPLFPAEVGRAGRSAAAAPTSRCRASTSRPRFYLLAEAFDADPFQLLHWRGRDRQTLLAHLRARRASALGGDGHNEGDGSPEPAPVPKAKAKGARKRTPKAEPAPRAAPGIGAAAALSEVHSPALADTVDRFWVAPVPLPARPPTLDTNVDLLLRQLAAPDSTLGGAELLARLRTLYTALS